MGGITAAPRWEQCKEPRRKTWNELRIIFCGLSHPGSDSAAPWRWVGMIASLANCPCRPNAWPPLNPKGLRDGNSSLVCLVQRLERRSPASQSAGSNPVKGRSVGYRFHVSLSHPSSCFFNLSSYPRVEINKRKRREEKKEKANLLLLWRTNVVCSDCDQSLSVNF